MDTFSFVAIIVSAIGGSSTLGVLIKVIADRGRTRAAIAVATATVTKTFADANQAYVSAHQMVLTELVAEVQRLRLHIEILEGALRDAGVGLPFPYQITHTTGA